MSGNFTNELYDNCHFQKRNMESVGPFQYQMYRGAYVNCNRCQAYQKTYVPLIDAESELKGITRLNSKCAQFKYNPKCKFTGKGPNACLSTFSPLTPISIPPEVCPENEAFLYFNNGLLRPKNRLEWPNPNIC
jgi:hypothetical protein